ncbi:MAG: NAD(P)/FAD-dependent oxidoreductase [Okeania sp. SIO2C2]|uniref:flavin-containing monooxygenase n=1 Tax=Okeania sp. SIO2C2 TaxID=2607787 RepID=UPI0013BC7691|nr:NAD(P)/FAD-dependent oxidoreductase [Okeania sp. SIO2C2]NEP88501.1 NAD(P)/FAD-dependent oxidoreductase [Okeania sp. SIO2C2]
MSTKHFDIAIVGAGLSGIAAAYYLQLKCPSKNYIILEGRDSMGGTWDFFRYPGIRSDSDMYTLGYSFKPWPKAKSIADGPSILKYIQETASENGIDKHIHYSLLVKKASWSSDRAVWTVETECKKTAKTLLFSCNFLLMCSGYYSYKEGYTPKFKGMESFKGEIVHPQHWPENLNYRGKKVVVIGSGATAITLVPEMAKDAKHVVMLQRSPTYVVSSSESDVLANLLNKFMPKKLAYAILRWKYIAHQQLSYRITRTKPEMVKQKLLELVRKELGDDYDVETHFTPRYNPLDQRLCLVPNGDLFEAIKSGNASVITDIIETFTEKGILLKSGKELEADLIVTATGLNLIILGGVQFSVDNQAIEFPKTYTYKGVMYSDVPNLVSVFGYINASWTLRAELVAEYVCRLINYMDEMGFRQCTPRLRDRDGNMQARSLIKDFSSGYIQRVMHLFPKQGDCEPWIYPQNYQRDKKMIRHGALEDGALIFSNKEI